MCVTRDDSALAFNKNILDTDFTSSDPNKAAWNVVRVVYSPGKNHLELTHPQVRSEFDEILLRHAAESGACVCEGVEVTGITFSSDDERRPVSASWKSDMGSKGEVRFQWLVDASGRTGLMSSKYLRNRKFNKNLKNIAFWAYWTGAGTYEPGTRRENAPWFEALTGTEICVRDLWSLIRCLEDETGWSW
jgi:hypothetical protein